MGKGRNAIVGLIYAVLVSLNTFNERKILLINLGGWMEKRLVLLVLGVSLLLSACLGVEPGSDSVREENKLATVYKDHT